MSTAMEPNEKEVVAGTLTRQRQAGARSATSSSEDLEHGTTPRASPSTEEDEVTTTDKPQRRSGKVGAGLRKFKQRFMRREKEPIGIVESLKNIAMNSCLNLLVVFLPLAWAGHFINVRAEEAHEVGEEYHPSLSQWPSSLTFAFCLLGLMPLERTFEYAGDQLSFYLGRQLGDLVRFTLNNLVEATLAIILVQRCEIKLAQSTIVGVIVLHLLLIPGVSFIVGGICVLHQELHPALTQLNHSLLTIGVLTLIIPVAIFSGLDRGAGADLTSSASVITDEQRDIFLRLSRGLAVILLVVYFCSRIYLHNPPGEESSMRDHPEAPEALKKREAQFLYGDPEVNQWVMLAVLLVLICIMGATAEWLVESLEFVREEHHVTERWFGIVLLPFASFAADGAVTLIFAIQYLSRQYVGHPEPPSTLAKGDAIDMSVQYTLFWMPFLVLLGWWTDKPMSLLFDIFEVAVAVGACFIVNYVTADSKTNWAEGMALLAFYAMIALASWWYEGQKDIDLMAACGSVASAVAEALAGGTESHGADH